MSQWVRELFHRSTHVAGVFFLLVLPLGYYPHNPDSTSAVVGVHGGAGQLAAVLRSCDGPLGAESSAFTDVGASVSVPVPPGTTSPVVLGVRVGYWHSDAEFPSSSGSSTSTDAEFSFVNPSISYETKYFGAGVGLLINPIPAEFFDESPNDQNEIKASGHLRIGNLEKIYFASSIAENTPIISGGSYFDFGLGYSPARNLRMFSGLSAAFYDGVGVLHQTRFKLNRVLDADITLRAGGAQDVDRFEGSIAGGLVFRPGSHR